MSKKIGGTIIGVGSVIVVGARKNIKKALPLAKNAINRLAQK